MKTKFQFVFLMLITTVFVASCATPETITKKEAFGKMYEEKPLAILALPPINSTTAADAKEYYTATLAEPISYAGYYLLSTEVTTEILKQEGLYDTELLQNAPLQKFKQFFGADAVLFIRILKWNTSYYVIGGHVVVGVDCSLKSTTTGAELWKYDGEFTLNTSGNSGGGLIGMIISTAIQTASASYIPVAQQANAITFSTLPVGKYHPAFNNDLDNKIILKKAKTSAEN